MSLTFEGDHASPAEVWSRYLYVSKNLAESNPSRGEAFPLQQQHASGYHCIAPPHWPSQIKPT